METLNKNTMKLIIPAPIERKLHAYVKAVDGEIAGMGEIEVRDDGNLWVVDVAIYDQEVTGGTADLSSEALAHFQTDLIKNGKSPKNWYLWWHSHANMGAFFSTTDTGTIETSTEFDHVVSLVVNKRRERKARLDTHTPFRITVLDLPIEVPAEVNPRTIEIDETIEGFKKHIEDLEEEKLLMEHAAPEGIEEEVAQKVKQKIYAKPARQLGFGHGGKQQADRSYLDREFDDSWSKKRKKDGSAIIIGEVMRGLDEDELLISIEQIETMIKAHEANGNGDTVECEELRADLQMYNDTLMDMWGNIYSLGLDDPENSYWNGQRWVKTWEPADDADSLPALPYPYSYGHDDERN
jgi:hypothetical protein